MRFFFFMRLLTKNTNDDTAVASVAKTSPTTWGRQRAWSWRIKIKFYCSEHLVSWWTERCVRGIPILRNRCSLRNKDFSFFLTNFSVLLLFSRNWSKNKPEECLHYLEWGHLPAIENCWEIVYLNGIVMGQKLQENAPRDMSNIRSQWPCGFPKHILTGKGADWSRLI